MNTHIESRVLARPRVAQRVAAMLRSLDEQDAALRGVLRADALTAMLGWTSIRVKVIDSSPDTDCSIAAIYLPDATPPEIGVVASKSRGRTNFSALHEFGHHLQLTIPELIDELGDQPDRGRMLEELTADAFAAAIQLPDDIVRRHLGSGTPTASQVADLYHASSASRAAVCVAAVQQLESPGHVVLLDSYGFIDFSASHGEFPLPRGSAQIDAAVVRALAVSERSAVDEMTRFTYRNGTKGPSLYAQATDLDGYTVIIAVSDKAPWRTLSLSSTERQVVVNWHTCERCEHVFPVAERCDRCAQPICPECSWCACRARALRERTCEGDCRLVQPAHMFDPGSRICRDCA